ncbi:STAS domain-containing protein [Xinfangfangia pollutisoli]|uniref:STAS domain-containing protein n=1 Tax=Xinfangfangia pollutisoli TaxID=2865960 RepID=UPI001CD4D9DC|nr:STAS domain-containing protein [Xinfangfangia pollutisoli]
MIRLEETASAVTVIAPDAAGLTAMTAGEFRRRVLALIEGGQSRFVIDLREVQDVDSSGIGTLVGLLKRIGLRGEMILCGPSEKVAQIFRLTRMDAIFPIQPDSAAALRALAA